MKVMPQGHVAFYSTTKGYGFIRPSDGGDDLFFHITRVLPLAAADEPEVDQRVEYEIGERNGRPTAVDVRYI